VGEILLTINEAAARLAIGRTSLYELISRRELRTVKIGRARRVPESAVDELISRQLRDQVADTETDALALPSGRSTTAHQVDHCDAMQQRGQP
jgi:excisionase family DNA binding protein